MAVVFHVLIHPTLNHFPSCEVNLDFGNQAGSDRIRKCNQQDPIEFHLFQTMISPSILEREKELRNAKHKENLHCTPAGVRWK